MSQLAVFRDLVRTHRRDVGRSQQQLAQALGLHPNVLSHKLNGHGRAVLTVPEVVGIVTALAQWGAIDSRPGAEELLAAAGVPGHAVPPTAWSVPPLSLLPQQSASPLRSADSTRATSPAARGGGGEPPSPYADANRLAPWRPTRPPAPVTRLVGRRDERREVAGALEVSRLVTLSGVGGTGKTRLAVQVAADVADRFADGVAFVDLSPVTSAQMLASAVAAALGLTPRADDATSVLTDALAARELLLVVDNLEHIVEGASVLSRLLEAAPGLRVLATSRVALRVYGEHLVRVPPLGLERHSTDGSGPGDAVQLFLDRATSAGQRVGGSATELDVLREICIATDGLPLAIELVAAATRVHSPEDLLRRLRSHAPLPDSSPRDAPDRQRTLRATLDWSFGLLSPPAQRLLACLGVCAGPFDAATAAAVSALSPGEADEALGELVDHSLLDRQASSGQLTLLQTIREYALARLAESGEQHAVERRTLTHHLEMTQELLQPADSTPAAGSTALDSIEAAYPNVRVALEHALGRGADDPECVETALLLANSLTMFWMRRGPMADGLNYLQGLLDAGLKLPSDSLRAHTLHNLCTLACFGGSYELGAAYGDKSIALFATLDDPENLARSLCSAGECRYAVGELETAAEMFRRGYRITRELGDRRRQAHLANMLGQLRNHQGAHDEARELLSEAVVHLVVAGSLVEVASVLHSLTEAVRDAGDLRSAYQLLQAVLTMSSYTGDHRTLLAGFEGMAAIASLQGDHAAALCRLGVARAVRERIGAALAPVEEATLLRAMAATFESTTEAEQQAAFADARTIAPQQLALDLVLDAPPVISGSRDDLTGWLLQVVEADGRVPDTR